MNKDSDLLEKTIEQWKKQLPELNDIMALKPIIWTNPTSNTSHVSDTVVTKDDMFDAMARWKRFAPYLSTVFPELSDTAGVIDSPLKKINSMKQALETNYQRSFSGDLLLKCDHLLPIAGSIKARGGIYEILKHAERLAIDQGMLSKLDNYKILSEDRFKQFFSNYTVGVGSTGNLALSIGIISAKMGFNVDVYMSSDAKQWKKDLLRSKGVQVKEFPGDFSKAVTEGRKRTNEQPNGHFVDDEHSSDLFLGYSTAAIQLKEQLSDQGITVDSNHPLYVYLPCGVGGAPGGITFGLKTVFGPHVHCYFVEPTHAPSMLIGLLTGEHDKVSVQDFGIDGVTEADGLAVGRTSSFASKVVEQLVNGIYTIEDEELFILLALLADSEKLELEPSAAAGLVGPIKIAEQLDDVKQSTHIVWSTGGALVPNNEMTSAYQRGVDSLS